jgi:shikimate dehydrogenase
MSRRKRIVIPLLAAASALSLRALGNPIGTMSQPALCAPAGARRIAAGDLHADCDPNCDTERRPGRERRRMTDRYAVIGHPVVHSRSPEVHAQFAQACGQDMRYDCILAPADGFRAAAEAFRAAGGRGLSVAAPFQLEAFGYAARPSARALACRSVNALKFEQDRIEGENFDGIGLVRDVQHRGQDLRGRRILLLGTGGTAHGVLPDLLAQQPAAIVVAHMDEDQARSLRDASARSVPPPTRLEACDYPGLAGERFDLVFNATSASLWNELPPVPATVFHGCSFAYELAYARHLTPFLRLAGNAGVPLLADGLGMLAEQAAETFAWWRGVRPATQALRHQLAA